MSAVGEDLIGVTGTAAVYDAETDEYEIDLQNVCLISLDSRTKVIRIKIKSNQINNKTKLQTISTQTIETNHKLQSVNTTEKEKEIDEIKEVQQTSNIVQESNVSQLQTDCDVDTKYDITTDNNDNYNDSNNNIKHEEIAIAEEAELLSSKQAMKSWFVDTVGLPQYFELFVSDGYEDLTYFDEDVIADDLVQLGIKKKGHRKKILKEIQKLILNPPQIYQYKPEKTVLIPNMPHTEICETNVNQNDDIDNKINKSPDIGHVTDTEQTQSNKPAQPPNDNYNEIADICNDDGKDNVNMIEATNDKTSEIQNGGKIADISNICNDDVNNYKEAHLALQPPETHSDNGQKQETMEKMQNVEEEIVKPQPDQIEAKEQQIVPEIIDSIINISDTDKKQIELVGYTNTTPPNTQYIICSDNDSTQENIATEPQNDSAFAIDRDIEDTKTPQNTIPSTPSTPITTKNHQEIPPQSEETQNSQNITTTQPPQQPETDSNAPVNDEQPADEEPEDEEVIGIDVAMTEMILKSATDKDKKEKEKEKASDDTNEDNKSATDRSPTTTAMSSNEYQFKIDWKISFIPYNIKKEWIRLIPQSSDPTQQHFSCNTYGDFDKCQSIQRIIFILNNYMLWIKYKISSSVKKKRYLNRDYPTTMTAFLNLLINYNKIRLMNDFYHIKRYHIQTQNGIFFEYFKSCLVTKSLRCISLRQSERVCLQWNRNQNINSNGELYGRGLYSATKRRNTFFITADSNIRSLSNAEMNEINLQMFLDMMHSLFVHKSISFGQKFVNKVYVNSERKQTRKGNSNNDESSAPDTDTTVEDGCVDDAKCKDGNGIIDAANYTFGFLLNFYDSYATNYVQNKYGNLKKELLNNGLYCMDKNDYNMLWFAAKDFLLSNEGRYCISKRTVKGNKGKYYKINKIGKEMTMDVIMSLMIYCNYAAMSEAFKRAMSDFSNMNRSHNKAVIVQRYGEIVNWCKCVNEAVYCYGDVGDGSDEYLYVNINCKLVFNVLQIQFNVPTSSTNQYRIAKSFQLNRNKKGICLKLRLRENKYLNMSNISHFPTEQECVIYNYGADRFDICDIYVNEIGLAPQLNVLSLYYQMIRGRWYTQNKNQFKKKNQREIIKYIQHMMDKEDNNNYTQRMFESMTRNLRKNIIWVNRNGMEQLLPELKELFFGKFLHYLAQTHNIKTQYSHVVVLKMEKKEIEKSSRDSAIYSEQYKHSVNIINNKNISDLAFSFRCYRKYDQIKKDMVLKAEFVIEAFSKRIESIRLSGGMLFPQISFDKWDFCTFSHHKLTKGSSLFSMKKLHKINDELIVKICFQIKEINPCKS